MEFSWGSIYKAKRIWRGLYFWGYDIQFVKLFFSLWPKGIMFNLKNSYFSQLYYTCLYNPNNLFLKRKIPKYLFVKRTSWFCRNYQSLVTTEAVQVLLLHYSEGEEASMREVLTGKTTFCLIRLWTIFLALLRRSWSKHFFL